MSRPTRWSFAAAAVLAAVLAFPAQAAGERLRPYLLGFRGAAPAEAKTDEVKKALGEKGFQVVGEYAPAAGVRVLVATNDALQATAARSPFGAYGAIVRVAVTDTGSEVQVSATNPRYFAAAYRLQAPLDDVADALAQAIGKSAEFGSKDGLTEEKLRKYHYMMMMPRFEDQVELARHPSHEAALAAVEAGLAARKGGTSKVYRVDVPGGKESVFGVALSEGEGADEVVRKACDLAELKHSPHFPYEIVVSGEKAFMLHGKFRIALDFPDLTMGKFMKISGAPSAIEAKLKAAAAGK